MPEEKIEHFPTTKKLHSDILEEKYSSIHAEVLEHNDAVREALLVDKNNIARTYALTFFPEKQLSDEIIGIDKEIRNGGMIGKVFRDHGYEVRKNVIDVFIIDIPNWLKNKFHDKGAHAKARISEFYAKKEKQSPVIYGHVLEVYTPDFRKPEINAVDMAQVNPSTEMFGEIGIKKDQIWERLEKSSEASEWDDIKEDFKKAKMKTRLSVYQLKEKMEDRLNAR